MSLRRKPLLVGWHLHSAVVIALMLFLAARLQEGSAAASFQDGGEYTPTTGHGQVIAQGVVDLAGEGMAWRTVRYTAAPADQSAFVAWPLGFVLATGSPLLLTDQAAGDQERLGPGEATLVRDDTLQRRESLDNDSAAYLAIELVPTSQAEQSDLGTVLMTWPVNVSEAGPHDVDLVRSVLLGTEDALLAGTDASNLLLVTDGPLVVRAPGEEGITLLAGEATTFSNEVEVVAAEGAEADGGISGIFVAAIIGPLVPSSVNFETVAEPQEEATPSRETGGNGSITVAVFNCPPGMDPETFVASACQPAIEDFDFVISGDVGDTTRTLADSVRRDGGFTWEDLPLGEYRVIEVILPSGFDTYLLAGNITVRGDPMTGYEVSLEPSARDVLLRVYNFDAR